MSTEYQEGYKAYLKGASKSANPYHWSDNTWWMVEDWERGWNAAQNDYYDDD